MADEHRMQPAVVQATPPKIPAGKEPRAPKTGTDDAHTRTVTLTKQEQRALTAYLKTALAPVIRSDWGHTDVLVGLLRRMESDSQRRNLKDALRSPKRLRHADSTPPAHE